MKEIFSRNKDINLTSFMNWRIEDDAPILNMLNMADGYLQAALILAEDSVNNNIWKKADIIIFPILTNANHGLELYLKALVWTLNKLLNLETKIGGGHNLQQLLQTTQARIKQLKGGSFLNNFNKDNDDLVSYINELFKRIDSEKKKDKMDFSRYPFTKNYENHFYVGNIGNVEVDLINFIERFTKIHESLEQYATDYFYHQELMREE